MTRACLVLAPTFFLGIIIPVVKTVVLTRDSIIQQINLGYQIAQNVQKIIVLPAQMICALLALEDNICTKTILAVRTALWGKDSLSKMEARVVSLAKSATKGTAHSVQTMNAPVARATTIY